MTDGPEASLMAAADRLLLKLERVDVGARVFKVDAETYRFEMKSTNGWHASAFIAFAAYFGDGIPPDLADHMAKAILDMLDRCAKDGKPCAKP